VLAEHEDVYVRALCASARRLVVAGREEIVHFPKNGVIGTPPTRCRRCSERRHC
jgi:hypothetical protein